MKSALTTWKIADNIPKRLLEKMLRISGVKAAGKKSGIKVTNSDWNSWKNFMIKILNAIAKI